MWCSVTFKAANLIFFRFFVSFFLHCFSQWLLVFWATGVLRLSVLHEERGTCNAVFENDSKINTHFSVVGCVCVRMWAGWSVCNQKYTHIRIYIHTSTHTLEFRGNTSILASPSSKVGLFLPHLVVTWLLSANQGFFLNEPLPQDMFLKVFFFFLKTAATLVNANWSLLRWLFLTVLHLDSDDSCPLYTFFPLEIWVLTRKMRNHGLI